MSRYLIESLSADKVITMLEEMMNIEEENELFLNELEDVPLQNELVIHRLHAIIMCKVTAQPPVPYDSIIDRQNLFQKFYNFLSQAIANPLDQDNQLTEGGLEAILELLQVNLQIPRNSEQIIGMQADYTQKILEMVYSQIRPEYQQALEIFVECMFLLSKMRKQVINQVLFSQILLKTMDQNEQFLQFLQDYFNSGDSNNFEVTSNLITCFSLRLPLIIQDEHLQPMLTRTYDSLKNFLRRQPNDSVWFNKLLYSQNTIIFDAFKALITKNFRHEELSFLTNQFVDLYLRCGLSPIIKYEFVLSLFKFVIQKAPILFNLLDTRILGDEVHFLQWFVQSQLKVEQETVETYMSNRFALEFLLSILIYYLHHFQEKTSKIKSKMNALNLLEEAKYFMDSESLCEFICVFYETIGQLAMFEEVYNRIKDQEIFSTL